MTPGAHMRGAPPTGLGQKPVRRSKSQRFLHHPGPAEGCHVMLSCQSQVFGGSLTCSTRRFRSKFSAVKREVADVDSETQAAAGLVSGAVGRSERIERSHHSTPRTRTNRQRRIPEGAGGCL